MTLSGCGTRRAAAALTLGSVRRRLRQIDRECRGANGDAWLGRAAALGRCADPDPDHPARVGRLAERVARLLDWSAAAARELRLAAELHDVGKYGLPRDLLYHARPLSPSERRLLVLHTQAADWLLAGLRHPVLRLGRTVGRAHHERWDGSGYPDCTAGAATPLPARIVGACDVWDALTHARPYRPAYTAGHAAEMVHGMAGRELDPQVTDALLHVTIRCHGAPPALAT